MLTVLKRERQLNREIFCSESSLAFEERLVQTQQTTNPRKIALDSQCIVSSYLRSFYS